MTANKFSVQILIPLILTPYTLKSKSRTDNLENAINYFKDLKIFDKTDQKCFGSIVTSSDLGFSDFIGKMKEDKFLKFTYSNKHDFSLCINDCHLMFLVSERIVYFDYNTSFIEILLDLNNCANFLLSAEHLESLHEALVIQKENNDFPLLNSIKNTQKSSDYLISDFFSISFFIEYDTNRIEEIHHLSLAFCGEDCSAKTIKEFKTDGIHGVYINHGFTGSFFFFQNINLDEKTKRMIFGMSGYLHFMTNVIPAFSIILNKRITQYKMIDKRSISTLESELHNLICLRDIVENILFDAYPQNVTATKLDSSIYENGFETWQFEKYVTILKEQIKRLTNVISEINEELISKQTKKANFTLKIISLFTATSVFADIFSQIHFDMGYTFLVIPIFFLALSVILFRKHQ